VIDIHFHRTAVGPRRLADRKVGCKVAARFLCYYQSAVVVLHGGGFAASAGEDWELAADGSK
jgi:hypothetical protein